MKTPETVFVLNSAIAISEETAGQIKAPVLWSLIAPASGSKNAMTADGRTVEQRFSPESNAKVALNFAPEVLVDREHNSVLTGDTTAYAWITQVEARPDGLYAAFNCTDVGWDALKNRRLRFPSAAFELDSLGYPVRLVSCALTNTPNLRNLPPILNKSAGQYPAHNTTSPATNGEKGDAQMKDILLALGLPETAEPAVVLNKVKEVLGQVVTLQTELKDIKTAALNKEAEEFVVLNSARIKPTDRDAVKARYVADKDNVVALFASLAEPQPTGRMVLNRADSRTPAAAGGNPETKSVERLALIRQIEAEHKVAPTVAFNMAQSRRPELFRE
jgi:hypothetical protein